jgi:phosphoribosylglycinamide formyltransferase-1
VDSGVDTGEIIAQAQVRRLPNDTLDALTERIHAAEHVLYPQIIQKLLNPQATS